MKLIDEKELISAAKKHADEVVLKETDASLSELNEYAQSDFICGAAFAEQKLLPKMVEFAEYCIESRILGNAEAPKQLLEQFITRDK